jgi:TPR repeat protein
VWQYEAARKYLDAGDPARAIPLLKDAAEAGHVESITELGQAYYRGRGVMQNYALAVTQFQRAARRGCSEAQYMLGVCYRAGQGVAQDYARAYAWFNLASAQGHPLASQARQELVNTLPPDVIAEGQKISLQISSEADSSDRDVPASP